MSLNSLSVVQLATVCAIFMVVVVVGQPSGENDESSQFQAAPNGLAVNVTTASGNHIEMPPFLSNLTSINPELRKCLVLDLEEVVDLLGGTLISRLKSKSILMAGLAWTRLATNMAFLARSQNARRHELGENRKVGTGNTYNKAVRAMFKDLMAKSQKEAKKLKGTPENPEAVADEVQVFFADLKEINRASPVSTYFDWKNGSINGQNFVDYMSKIMAKLYHNGYSTVFTSVEVLLNLLVKFSG